MRKTLHSIPCGLLVFLSAFNVNADSQWTPLGLSNFIDTATDSSTASPNGESAPRQGWLSTPDGFLQKNGI